MVKLTKNHKNKQIESIANITLTPIPKSCYDCPFYYMPNPDEENTWYEYWDCFLKPLDNQYGVALERHKNCPLNT